MKMIFKKPAVILNWRNHFTGNLLKTGLAIALTLPSLMVSQTITTGPALERNIVARQETEMLAENDFTPKIITLSQNYPNPFNPSTTIQYSIKNAGMVSLKVYNLLGHEIVTLVNSRQEAGSYIVQFNTHEGKRILSSGMYFYRLETGSFVSIRKLVVLK